MGSYEEILNGINAYFKRLYTHKIIKGLILFTGIEIIVGLTVTSIEIAFWLPSLGRQFLLILLILQFVVLLFILIIRNILLLIRSKSEDSAWEASKAIGVYFPEVKDRLTNLIELQRSPLKNELVLAGIAQRSEQLKDVPFYLAVNFTDLMAPAKRVLLPVVLILLVLLSWKGTAYSTAFNRIITYNKIFEKPAPFQFKLASEKLHFFDYQNVILKVGVDGPVRPKEVRLIFNGESYRMTDRKSHFETTLSTPVKSGEFYFSANGVESKSYTLTILPVPTTESFNLKLSYPTYLNKASATLNGTGSAIVPEGTQLTWEILTVNTDSIHLINSPDTVAFSRQGANKFLYSTNAISTLEYSITSSNKYTKHHNTLDYTIEVIPDTYPKIDVALSALDSLENTYSFTGTISDDYGLAELYAILINEKDSTKTQEIVLGKVSGTLADFNYNFPNGFRWEENGAYFLYFTIRDNDGLRGGKTTTSAYFKINKASEQELEKNRLEQQKSILESFGKIKNNGGALEKEWNKQIQSNKESSELNYDERKAIRDLINRQKQQEDLMQSFSKELTKSFGSNTPKDKEDQLVLERLERQEKEARKNAKLLEELDKVMNELDQEEFNARMEEFSKNQIQNQRSLEQLLELTKRYFVNQLARQLSDELNRLGEKQKELSEQNVEEEYTEQDSIREAFDQLQESLKDLNSKNNALKRPLPWKRDELKEKSVEDDIQKALEELKNLDSPQVASKFSKKQSEAARKIKELAQQLSQETGASASASQNAEDAESLRQILENLVDFSLEQESLLKASSSEQQLRSGIILKQRELRELFEHVDDSIFALSLRQPAIAESINKKIADIYYNVDKGLEMLSENQWMQVNSYQQYTLAGANDLASLLAKILENLQESLKPSQGNGAGSNFQLPDIIQSQGDLQQQLSEFGKGKKQHSEEGQKEEESTSGKKGASNAPSESESEMENLYEIYKEQNRIRSLLEKQLENITSEFEQLKTKEVLRDMEELENTILNEGINESVMQRVNRIQNQLLKLKEATLQQGEGEERKSNTNLDEYNSNVFRTIIDPQENALPQIEILNRQPLPLRLKYKDKVKVYFSKDD